ncbi:hypothetical protein HPQ64_17405 [Rhizobiales bacterium]|uniref:hypothetical protein n=1 Tax=Hongsoonwoonella zoysiae TaxID=2821844 RepID=UPI00155FB4EE|nr:hypothetical protein [Hongsoonwoonella zoysiae]NRG19473.1 hypothetical protein [Hongsoonwoonella zoysiae]
MNKQLERIQIFDHKAFGRLIADYATGRKAWPESIEEFRAEVEGPNIAKIPEHMRAIQVVQPSDEIFFLRLPPKTLFSQSLERYAANDANGSTEPYPAPPFYSDMVCREERLTHTDFFLSRVADYTISVCS